MNNVLKIILCYKNILQIHATMSTSTRRRNDIYYLHVVCVFHAYESNILTIHKYFEKTLG